VELSLGSIQQRNEEIMGTSSKGRRVQIKKRQSPEHDIEGQPTFIVDFVRTNGGGKCKNCPPEYDPSKMKVIPRSKRGK